MTTPEKKVEGPTRSASDDDGGGALPSVELPRSSGGSSRRRLLLSSLLLALIAALVIFFATQQGRDKVKLSPAEIAIESPTMAQYLIELHALKDELRLLETRITKHHDRHRELSARISALEMSIARYADEWNRR